ncbi:MAG: hypothetical protein KF767_05565 [Bdellovibrionaceae bacterium]|nr:hypothetical protein [Pseudobdellovibrionaceae bacterium]
MKNFVLGLSLVLASVSANATATSWASINKNLDVVAKDVQKDFAYLTDLSVKFDARSSDLAGDRLKASLSASTDQAKWGDNNVTLAIGAGLDARTLVGTKRTMKGELTAGLKTQVIAGVKYALTSVMGECSNVNPKPENYREIRDVKVCEFISNVNAVNTIPELQAAITTAYADYVTWVPTYVKEQQELLKAEKDEEKKWPLESNIQSAESDLKNLSKLKISGDVNKIVLALDASFSFGTDISVKFQVTLTEQNAKAALTGVGSIDDETYQEFKKMGTEILTRIEQNEQQMMEFVTELAKGYAQFIGEYITK